MSINHPPQASVVLLPHHAAQHDHTEHEIGGERDDDVVPVLCGRRYCAGGRDGVEEGVGLVERAEQMPVRREGIQCGCESK